MTDIADPPDKPDPVRVLYGGMVVAATSGDLVATQGWPHVDRPDPPALRRKVTYADVAKAGSLAVAYGVSPFLISIKLKNMAELNVALPIVWDQIDKLIEIVRFGKYEP